MPSRIEDYAMIGDCQTAALVGRDGSIDWLCFPRFDSGACFAALLGTRNNGRWQIVPKHGLRDVRRQYRDDTLILETTFVTSEGEVTLIDFMTIRTKFPDLVRIVVGKRGKVTMSMELIMRFDYGSIVPWVQKIERGLSAIAGPDRLCLRTEVEMVGKEMTTVAEFTVSEGERITFDLSWHLSHVKAPEELDAEDALISTEQWWREWAGRCEYAGEYREAVVRSLITLKALTYAPTGGLVAAPTTSLPEALGGVRNWDYRYCWLRDATFTLAALLNAGYREEAREWREWLLRAVAGDPSQLNIVYGLSGERRLPELELDWLPGYENSRPVRTGNAAYKQFQLDVFGEIIDMLYQSRKAGITFKDSENGWRVGLLLFEYLERTWQMPDEGIWEIRGPRRHFTHSKMMAWVAFDRAVKAVDQFRRDGPRDHWQKLADQIHEEICREGFNQKLGAFVQFYGSDRLDASLLLMPLVGFLPIHDRRVKGTITAIEKHLLSQDGFVARYLPDSSVDGLPEGEAAFLPCTFWLADNYALLGREDDARRIFERMLNIRNDVGLLAEEYDVGEKRMLGNFPQAFSHIGLINTAVMLTAESKAIDVIPAG